jgi:SH3 domain protein
MAWRVASGLDGEERDRGSQRALGAAIALALLLATGARAETAWIKDEVRLNVRSGPGTKYRILDSIGTGDRIEVLKRGEGWTQVRSGENEGWIPEGFLQPEPPAAVRLARLEAQTTDTRATIDALTAKAEALEAQNSELSDQESSQRSQIDQLTRENFELKASARWPEWITGAGILAVGMLMGAILQSVSGRRSRPRIRL